MSHRMRRYHRHPAPDMGMGPIYLGLMVAFVVGFLIGTLWRWFA